MRPGQSMLDDALRAQVEAYVEVRCATVTSLVKEVREALAPSGVQLTFVDHGGTMAHVMHGVRRETNSVTPTQHREWRFGRA